MEPNKSKRGCGKSNSLADVPASREFAPSLSLNGLELDDVLRAVLSTPPPPEAPRAPRKKVAAKRKR